MGTKSNPGVFDFYSSALPDEPIFILLARDESAPDIVVQWAMSRLQAVRDGTKPQTDIPMVREALNCAVDMVLWRIAKRGSAAGTGQLPEWHNRKNTYQDQKELAKALAPMMQQYSQPGNVDAVANPNHPME